MKRPIETARRLVANKSAQGSPVISDGATDDSKEDPQCDDPSWNEQHVVKFR